MGEGPWNSCAKLLSLTSFNGHRIHFYTKFAQITIKSIHASVPKIEFFFLQYNLPHSNSIVLNHYSYLRLSTSNYKKIHVSVPKIHFFYNIEKNLPQSNPIVLYDYSYPQ